MPENIAIIGSGPAAWTAAIYAARANLKPLVFQGNPHDDNNRQNGTMPLGQLGLTTDVENFPGWPAGHTREYLKTALKPDDPDFPYWVSANQPQPAHGITGPELVALMRQQAVNAGTRIESKDVVRCVLKRSPFALIGHDGQTVEARAVIIATGARANYLGLPSEEHFKNNGVSACAVCDGALPRFRGKPIVVVGGGDTAIEEAAYLSKFGSKVHLLVRRDVLRASKIMANRAKSIANIEIHWNSEVEEVVGDIEAGVTAVRVMNNRTGARQNMPAAGLFLAIGHTPNVGFLGGQVEQTETGHVKWKVPGRTYTSVEGVFAAGDVADAYYRQAVTAAGTGCMAALDAERWLGRHDLI